MASTASRTILSAAEWGCYKMSLGQVLAMILAAVVGTVLGAVTGFLGLFLLSALFNLVAGDGTDNGMWILTIFTVPGGALCGLIGGPVGLYQYWHRDDPPPPGPVPLRELFSQQQIIKPVAKKDSNVSVESDPTSTPIESATPIPAAIYWLLLLIAFGFVLSIFGKH